MTSDGKSNHFLKGTAAYLSGPMDFVGSRDDEREYGWRRFLKDFLTKRGVVVFDPWDKPKVRGLHEYGAESDDNMSNIRNKWTFDDGVDGYKARAACAGDFWSSLHIDLRMVDKADFVICYCPTNVYSVGTVHEIVMARTQRKPVLFVSPRVEIGALAELRAHLAGDAAGTALLEKLEKETPIKPNPRAVPSAWYMPLIGVHNFFDGFGFDKHLDDASFARIPRDHFPHESPHVVRPLLSYLQKLHEEGNPRRYDTRIGAARPDDDWLLWDSPAST